MFCVTLRFVVLLCGVVRSRREKDSDNRSKDTNMMRINMTCHRDGDKVRTSRTGVHLQCVVCVCVCVDTWCCVVKCCIVWEHVRGGSRD